MHTQKCHENTVSRHFRVSRDPFLWFPDLGYRSDVMPPFAPAAIIASLNKNSAFACFFVRVRCKNTLHRSHSFTLEVCGEQAGKNNNVRQPSHSSPLLLSLVRSQVRPRWACHFDPRQIQHQEEEAHETIMRKTTWLSIAAVLFPFSFVLGFYFPENERNTFRRGDG